MPHSDKKRIVKVGDPMNRIRIVVFVLLVVLAVGATVTGAASVADFKVKFVEENRVSMWVKIYNPEHKSLTVRFSFLDGEGFELEAHQRSQGAFPNLYSSNGDTTIFRDTRHLSKSVVRQLKSYSVKVSER